MTVSSSTRRAGPFAGNGVTTSFPFTFKVFATGDVAVYLTDDDGVQTLLGSNYTVTLNPDQDASPGGTLSYPTVGSPLAAGHALDLIGDLDFDQETDITNMGRFLPQVIENALDKLTILAQQLREKAGRSLSFPVGDTATNTLPAAASRANKALVFDEDGNVGVSVDNYTDQLANVTAQAGIATTQAGVATAQAGVAAMKASEASGFRDETLGYLQAYRATSYGALAEDPTEDPNGSPCTVGDEYFNTTVSALKRFNGTTWYIPDLDAADLASSSGAAMVVFIQTYSGSVARTVRAKLGESLSALDLGVVADGAENDTAALNDAIAEISLSLAGEGNQLRTKLVIPSDWSAGYGKVLIDCIQMQPDVCLSGYGAVILKRIDGAGPLTNALLRVDPLYEAGTYYGQFKNMRIEGLRFNANGKACPANIVNLLFIEDAELHDLSVVHTAGVLTNWGFSLGGRNIQGSNLRVFGGNDIFQDGIHLQFGDGISLAKLYAESGDDGLALGREGGGYFTLDPQSLRNVTIAGYVANAKRGSAVKVYCRAGELGVNSEVADVSIVGMVGKSGQFRNGGIAIEDDNAGAAGTSQIKRIQIEDMALGVGGATHDDTNPYGILVRSALEVSIKGTLELTQATVAPATGFRLGQVEKSEGVALQLKCSALRKNGGFSFVDSRRVSLNDSTIKGSAQQTALGHVNLNNVDGYEQINTKLLDVPSTLNGVQFTAAAPSSAQIRGGKIAHAAGAVSGTGIAGIASSFGYLDINGIDLSGCVTPLSSSISGSANDYNIRAVRGAKTRISGQATINSGQVAVTVTHGAAVGVINTGQISVTPDSTWGNATKWWISDNTGTTFKINCDIAPGANFTFRWVVDSGQKPAT